MAGSPDVEESEVLSEAIEKVMCRWCGASDRIEVVPRPASDDPEPGLGGTP